MSRGGMCATPFAGFERLDRIDFTAFASGSTAPEQLLFLNTITDAASAYLFFGLGRNGMVIDEFWYATEYFFTCRATLPETWGERTETIVYEDPNGSGKRLRKSITHSDEDMRLGCFDVHYDLAALNRVMPFDVFVTKLEQQRMTILASAWDQVIGFLFPGKFLTLNEEMAVLSQLIRPTGPDELVAVIGGHL